jgi:hypothetical protein
MSKFLRLIEENQPDSESGSRYTISIKGPAEFEDIEISGDSFANHIYQSIYDYVHGEGEGLPEDEASSVAEMDLEAMDAAANLAITALKMPTKQQIKKLKKRQGVLGLFQEPVAKAVDKVKKKALGELNKFV